MPGCHLQVVGEFDVNSLLVSCKRWKPERIRQKGEFKFKSEKERMSFSGFTLTVSESEDFEIQIEDALKFIDLYKDELQTLRLGRGEAKAYFSFSKLYEKYTFPYAWFPTAIVLKAAEFGLGLEVGMFPMNETEG